MLEIIQGDNIDILSSFSDESFRMIYTDPPFNTGNKQTRENLSLESTFSYDDKFSDYKSFLYPRIKEAKRLLKKDGSFFLHLDWREVHYAKIWCDEIFGRKCFQNHIIWAFDYGGRSKRKYSAKHNDILWYSKSPKNYVFHYDQIKRIPYLAPGLVGPEKAKKGKTITDVIWQTIVPTNSKENLKYPTQKPIGLLSQFIKVHTDPKDMLLDFFAGSGSLGQAANDLGRDCVLIDNNPQAIETMKKRFADAHHIFWQHQK